MTSKARFSQLLPLHTHCIIHVHKTTLKKLYKRQRSRSFGSFMRSKAKVQLTPNRQNVWVQETTTDGNMYSQLYQQQFSYPQVMDISEYSDKIRQKRERWENCLYLSLVLYSIKNPAGKIRETPKLQEKSCGLCLEMMKPLKSKILLDSHPESFPSLMLLLSNVTVQSSI